MLPGENGAQQLRRLPPRLGASASVPFLRGPGENFRPRPARRARRGRHSEQRRPGLQAKATGSQGAQVAFPPVREEELPIRFRPARPRLLSGAQAARSQPGAALHRSCNGARAPWLTDQTISAALSAAFNLHGLWPEATARSPWGSKRSTW